MFPRNATNFLRRSRPGLVLIAAALFMLSLTAARADEGKDYFLSPQYQRPMRSVELQYFRLPRDQWDPMLRRMAWYNADTISTYVDWGFHEYEEGNFDFTGKTLPERDLVGFIKLCERRGFKVVLKPGPFIDAEVYAGGIPRWLLQKYPETIAINKHGRPYIEHDTNLPRVSYLHPKYLELVDRYYRELAKAVASEQWPNGPIVAVQVDNETPGDGIGTFSNYFAYYFKADYNEYYKKTAWPQWLAARYKNIAALNAAYGSSYASFTDVPLLNQWGRPMNEKQLQIYLDLDRFAEWQYEDALRRYRAMLQDAGFYAPTYQDLRCMPWDMEGMVVDMGGMAQAVGGWIGVNDYALIYRPWTVFTGADGYRLNWDEYVHNAIWRVKLSGSLSAPHPALVPELSASQRFYFQAPIAWGADAVNLYTGVQTERDNPLVSPRVNWSMECCITAGGEPRDCLWNAKLTYLFMEYSGGFLPGATRPRLAIAYSHEPEHAWNWEFRSNLDLPHHGVRHLRFKSLVHGANTGDRSQLIARELVKRGVAFDVVALDHLRPGQLDPYGLVIVPSASGVPPIPGRAPGSVLVLKPGGDDLAQVKKLDLAHYREAWALAPDVDVAQRFYAADDIAIVSILNRNAREYDGQVIFRSGENKLSARLGPKAVGFVSVHDGGLKAAVLDHPQGLAQYAYNNDLMSFTGAFATIAVEPGAVIVSALDSGAVAVRCRHAPQPAKLLRLLLDGRVQDAPFTIAPDRTISFTYDSGQGPDRTDIYVALAPGATLDQVLGDYLTRAAAD